MTWTQFAVILVGIWLILIGASVAISNTVTLIFGIVVVILVLMDGRVAVPVAPTRRAP